MDVDVDEPGRYDPPGLEIEHLRAVGGQRAADGAHPAVVDEHIELSIHTVHRIDDAGAFEQQLHARSSSSWPASRYNTAIRTATPLATCSRITEYGPSATSESISTPLFMGPG
jgi:hypothetical protein